MVIIGILLLAVVFIVVSSARWHWHPFLSLLTASIGVGIAARIPAHKVIEEIVKGFGSVIGSIGIVVVLGSIVGVLLERSGAIAQLGAWMLARLGKRRPSLILTVLGTLLGIPVFCDSGFIVLVSLAKSLSKRTNTPFPVMSLSLATGLYASHTLVPPTPGPIAAAGTLGVSNELGLVILVGILVSIPVSLVAHWAAVRIGARTKFDESVFKETHTPVDVQPRAPVALALTLIVMPLLFITIASLTTIMNFSGVVVDVVQFLGHPVIALLITVFAGMISIRTSEPKLEWVQQGVVQSGSIILLTGCGGAFGAVIRATPLTATLTDLMQGTGASGIVFLLIAFSVTAMLKTAQGSSTSAIVIASALLTGFAGDSGFVTPLQLSLLVAAIGAGAMTVSHANDSYFWVISQFTGLALREGYRSITIITFVQGVTALLATILLYILMT